MTHHCIDCSSWSMWDSCCHHPAQDSILMHPDTIACQYFDLDLDEVALDLGRPLTCGDCTRASICHRQIHRRHPCPHFVYHERGSP